MRELEWNDKTYGTGIILMDAHHRELFNILRSLRIALQAGQGRDGVDTCVARLADYAKFHFAQEEELLARHGYTGLADQQRAHAEFTTQVARMQQPDFVAHDRPALEMLVFLQGWLAEHIAVSDRAYGAWLTARGVH